MLKLLGATPLRLLVLRAGGSGLFPDTKLLGESNEGSLDALCVFRLQRQQRTTHTGTAGTTTTYRSTPPSQGLDSYSGVTACPHAHIRAWSTPLM